MNENSKVMVQIEYERDGTRRAFYGEIDGNKLEEFHTGEESFICLLNDGEIAWIDKEAILSVYELETKLRVYEKYGTQYYYIIMECNLKYQRYYFIYFLI
ncbi:hypothetical protein ES707_19299 [subsurface metagenome]